MEYSLLIAFVVGLLLFILSWLRIVYAGFRHHFFTGLVALFPVVNVLILPSVWHRVYGSVILGLIGLLMAIATWMLGANQVLARHSTDWGLNLPLSQLTSTRSTTPTTASQQQLSLPTPTSSTHAPAAHQSDTAPPTLSGAELPRTALYRMIYQPIAINSLASHHGQYVRLTLQDRRQVEGKLLLVAEDKLSLERRVNGSLSEHQINLHDIASSEVITKE